jgi:hypothetical protein
MSDTIRTGTEQLLISCAVERAVERIGFEVLAGQNVYLDTTYLKGAVDEGYITSTLRQHMVAHGCILKTDRRDAEFIVEARAFVGTNRQEVLVGIPQMQLPNMGVPGVPSSVPEIALAKSTNQKGVAKVAVFAYHQETGQPVWQSGATPVSSNAKDTWLFGAGPWQRGSIYKGTRFAGDRIQLPFRAGDQPMPELPQPIIAVAAEQMFQEPADLITQFPAKPRNPQAAEPPAESLPSPQPTPPPTALPAPPVNPTAVSTSGFAPTKPALPDPIKR